MSRDTEESVNPKVLVYLDIGELAESKMTFQLVKRFLRFPFGWLEFGLRLHHP
jgi:hypothetical protein